MIMINLWLCRPCALWTMRERENYNNYNNVDSPLIHEVIVQRYLDLAPGINQPAYSL